MECTYNFNGKEYSLEEILAEIENNKKDSSFSPTEFDQLRDLADDLRKLEIKLDKLDYQINYQTSEYTIEELQDMHSDLEHYSKEYFEVLDKMNELEILTRQSKKTRVENKVKEIINKLTPAGNLSKKFRIEYFNKKVHLSLPTVNYGDTMSNSGKIYNKALKAVLENFGYDFKLHEGVPISNQNFTDYGTKRSTDQNKMYEAEIDVPDKSFSPTSFADEVLNNNDEGLWNDGDIEIDTQSTSNKRPRSDNFVEMINFYSKQIETLKRLSSSLNNKLNSNLKSKELAEKKADIDSRISKYTGLVNDLRRGNNFHKIFHAIKSDLDDINQALDQNIIIEGMREKLDFFHMLLKGAGYINKDVLYDVESIEAYNPDSFNKFNRYLDDIALKYQNKLREIAKARINEDIAYANNLGDKLSEDELDDLLSNRDDINYLELQTLGITESMNSETIIPQIIKSVLETAMVENESIIKDKKHRLINAAKNLKSKDFTWIFEKTKFGNSTGNLMSLYTHEFYEALEDYKRIKLYTENPQERIYKEIEWLRSNVEVIDVTKLSWVKDIYGDEYSIYFTHSDEDMEAYDNQLKSILGSQYESEKKKILDKLSLFKLKADAISSSNTPNADLEILRQSPFEFSRNYYSSNIQTTINIINDNGQTVSTDIDLSLDNFSFIPKIETVESLKADGSAVMKDSGYYNKNFESILSDPAKKEYYEAIVDLYSNFINPIYGKDQLDSLSYGKMEEELMEIISTAKGFDKVTGAYARMKNVAKSMISDPDHNNTSNGVKSNYTDSFEHQRRELAKVLTLKPLNELKQMAKENGLINITGESKRIIVRELSYKLADQGFSKDLTSLTVALADLASQHQARQDALPIIENLAEMHYSVKKEDGGIRTNSNKKLQNYIDVIVKNDPVKDGKDKLHEQAIVKSLSGIMEDLPYTKGKGGIKKVYSDTDKIIKEELEKLQAEGHKPGETTFTMDGKIYQSKYSVKNKKFFYTITSTDPKTGDRFESVLEEKDFEEAFQAYIKYKLDHLGVPMTMGSVVTGIQKILILKGMALNPFSGIINRVEGRDTNFRMDATGLYWTPGNMEYANNFLALSNLTKLSNKLVDPPIEKMKQIELFVKLMHEFNVIQDRKSELDKNISNSNYSIEGWLNVYAPAIDHPEFKNQGEIVLSILMDTKIKDANGEEYPFFNKDTMTFTAYELVDGNLKLKDEFNTEDNQKTWGSFGVDRDNIENNGYLLARSKMKHAIARSQGNYESNDTQMILNSTLGRVVSQYKRWLPEHVMQRFNTNDKDYDLQTGKKKQKGRYIHVLDNAGALGGLGLFNLALGVGATPFMAAIGVGLTASAIGLHLYRKYSGKAVKTQANQVMVFADFMRSIAFSFLNYPLRVLHLPSKWRLNHQIKTGYTQLTEDEARQLSAAAVEMSHKLTYMIITMIGTALLWDDEDDEKKARARFFINQSQKLSNSANMYLDPKAFMEDSTRVSFFQWINDIYKVSKAIAGEDEFEAKQVGKLFMPRIVADIAFDGTVVQDKKEFTPGAIEVVIGKNYATDGNYTAKKKIEKVRSKYREEVTKQLESTLEGEALEKAVETRVKEKYPPKKKSQTYKEYLENLETQDSEK